MPSLSPFGKALIAAMVLHGIWVVRCLVTAPPSPNTTARLTSAELQIEVEPKEHGLNSTVNPLSLGANSTLVQPEPLAARLPTAARPPAARVIAGAAAQPTAQEIAELGNDSPQSNAAAPSSQPEPAASIASKIDLGLNGGLLRALASQAPTNPPEPQRKPRARRDGGADFTREFNASILADNLRRGHARGNVLVGPLNSAVREVGLARGEAVIRVTLDSQGALSGVELLKGDARDWAAVLKAFRQRASSKRVSIPSGALGLRVTLNVSAKIQRTSGKEVQSSAVGVNQPSLAPNGMTFMGDFDLSDIANKTNHNVYARVVAEELL